MRLLTFVTLSMMMEVLFQSLTSLIKPLGMWKNQTLTMCSDGQTMNFDSALIAGMISKKQKNLEYIANFLIFSPDARE
jgi:hypothetical protein